MKIGSKNLSIAENLTGVFRDDHWPPISTHYRKFALTWLTPLHIHCTLLTWENQVSCLNLKSIEVESQRRIISAVIGIKNPVCKIWLGFWFSLWWKLTNKLLINTLRKVFIYYRTCSPIKVISMWMDLQSEVAPNQMKWRSVYLVNPKFSAAVFEGVVQFKVQYKSSV